MTQSQPQPIDPDAVAEIAPGDGPEPGSAYYGGSEIHSDSVDGGADPAGGDPGADAGEAVTTEAGTFEDLPVTPDEQVE
jgi:hypothetical protein